MMDIRKAGKQKNLGSRKLEAGEKRLTGVTTSKKK